VHVWACVNVYVACQELLSGCVSVRPVNLRKGYPLEKLADVKEIAKTYYHLHMQNKMAWTNEIDIRPHTEDWTC